MVGALQNPYQKYLKTKIETASQPQLLVMLFDAASKKLHIAKDAIHKGVIEDAHNNLVKVQKIFSELMLALDFDIGGDLAKQLFSIYEFVYRRLVDANIKQDATIIDEVMPIVEQLREGWTEAVTKFESDPDAARAEAAAAKAQKSAAAHNDDPEKKLLNGTVTTLPLANRTTNDKPVSESKPEYRVSGRPETKDETSVQPMRGTPGAAAYGRVPQKGPATPPPAKSSPSAERPRLNLQG